MAPVQTAAVTTAARPALVATQASDEELGLAEPAAASAPMEPARRTATELQVAATNAASGAPTSEKAYECHGAEGEAASASPYVTQTAFQPRRRHERNAAALR